MCGFAGFFSRSNLFGAQQILTDMGNVIYHRGPDDYGVWFDTEAGVGLSHRRLSIVDLTPAGHQPMFSSTGRFVIVFNGEIYNHLNLRDELNSLCVSPAWRGHSDTETLLAGFEAWGIKKTIEKSIGMFAFAVWDSQQKKLILGRDRIGEKPLYYGLLGDTFLFGSELKALKAHPLFNGEINRDALSLLLKHSYIPAPYSIYKNIYKLKPGNLLTYNTSNADIKIDEYWSVSKAAIFGAQNPHIGSANDVVEELEKLLKCSIQQQMIADVPIGAFLSGGIDSSTIVALMQSMSHYPVKTFSIGFNEDSFNEALYAKAVAKHLKTDHTELYVPPKIAMGVIPSLSNIYDEPFADSSQIPTYLVSQLARENVTVSLSGDAGDELFSGYNRYLLTEKIWHKISFMPNFIRRNISKIILSISPSHWDTIISLLPSVKVAQGGDKIHKAASVLTSSSIESLYNRLVSHHRHPCSLVIDAIEPDTVLNGLKPVLPKFSDIEVMMALDMISYLPDDILVKVDRAAMAASLETRVPFLDHRIVEFSWRVPLSVKMCNGQTKWPLRQILHRYVPQNLIERPKMGFGIPLHDWLRGPLREWSESLLAEDRLHREGFFYPHQIRKLWNEHISGKYNRAYLLWNILMFQSWYEQQ
ncbi:asparagine synthase (glutamine-hydrolyzing) [Zooshikella sp. RANM57]|uniref:asparagine synthase (glutamine-hydrolyzing) n=1 Tax=Zooshikella sp. RANM57 TaxID=3425863 RepID=UPI003D6F3F0D